MSGDEKDFLLEEEIETPKSKYQIPNIEFDDLLVEDEVKNNTTTSSVMNEKKQDVVNESIDEDLILKKFGNSKSDSKKHIHKKLVDIDSNLYEDLIRLAKYEDLSINKMINTSIRKLLGTKNNKEILKKIKEVEKK